MAVKKSDLKKFLAKNKEVMDELKKRQPPPKTRIVWTDEELIYLKAFLDDLRSDKVSISTMAKHYEALVAPAFPDKSKSAWQKMANEITRGDRQAEAKEREESGEDDGIIMPPLRITKK